MLTLRLFRLEMKSGLPFTSAVKATVGFFLSQRVGGSAISIAAFVRSIASSATAEVGFLREGISSLTDSTIDRLAFCGAVMRNPRGQTQKIYFMLKMLKGPTGILPQPFGGNVMGHQPVNPNKVDACYRLGDRKILQADRFRVRFK
jgi:hypothetical protein